MRDCRLDKVAELLLDYSIKIQPGENLKITGDAIAMPLISALEDAAWKRGANVKARILTPNHLNRFIRHVNSREQVESVGESDLQEARETDAAITIRTMENPYNSNEVSPELLQMRTSALSNVKKIYRTKRWCAVGYPTKPGAYLGRMSDVDFEDLILSSIIEVDWKKVEQMQDTLSKMLDSANYLRILGQDTDITFDITGRKTVNCCGICNMPDGEVFLSPIENAVEGRIQFTYPLLAFGERVPNIYLEFKNGEVSKAISSSKNGQAILDRILQIPGAKKVGEIAIGTNEKITKFLGDVLFDEKMDGTMHLAIGQSVAPDGLNQSEVHYDIVKDLREGPDNQPGTVMISNDKEVWTTLQHNGKWAV